MPLLVSFAVMAVPAAAQPKLPEAPLTVRATVGTGASESRTLTIAAVGPAPTRETTLTDETGRHTATARTLQSTDVACQGTDVRATGLGEDRWCIRLDGLAPGHVLKGRLAGAGGVVVLTATARHGWLLPAVVAALSLVVAIVLVWATSTWLPVLTVRALLSRELREDGGIAGLKGWADRAGQGRIARSGILSRVRWAKRYGKGQVLAARDELDDLLASGQTRIPPSPLRDDAVVEAARTDVKVGELLTPGGARATSEAERLFELVARADHGIRAFEERGNALLRRIPAEHPDREAAEKLVERLPRDAVGYLSEFTLERFEASLRNGLETLRSYVSAIEAEAADRVAGVAETATEPEPPIGARPRTAAVAAARTVLTGGAVVLAAGLLMAVAVVAVLASQYFPNQTFGTAEDYLVLAATMVGSSTAAGAVTVLLLLRGPEDWYA